jgi:hypothetical protein
MGETKRVAEVAVVIKRSWRICYPILVAINQFLAAIPFHGWGHVFPYAIDPMSAWITSLFCCKSNTNRHVRQWEETWIQIPHSRDFWYLYPVTGRSQFQTNDRTHSDAVLWSNLVSLSVVRSVVCLFGYHLRTCDLLLWHRFARFVCL